MLVVVATAVVVGGWWVVVGGGWVGGGWWVVGGIEHGGKCTVRYDQNKEVKNLASFVSSLTI
jgi:hypothetical protein